MDRQWGSVLHKRYISAVLASLGLVLVGIGGGSAEATTVVAMDDAELVAHSDLAGLIHILNIRHKQGFRIITAEVVRDVRQSHDGSIIQMILPGGEVGGGMVTSVPGSPERVSVGQYWWVFLAKRKGSFVPVGLGLGMLHAQRSGKGGFMLERASEGLNLVGGGSATKSIPKGARSSSASSNKTTTTHGSSISILNRASLNDFADRIEAIAARTPLPTRRSVSSQQSQSSTKESQ